MQINVSSNVKRAERNLLTTQKKHIPFALSRSMQLTVNDGMKAGKLSARKYLDRPNQKIVDRAFRRRWPSKAKVFTQDAKVFIAPWIAREYRDLVYGDTVTDLSNNTIITPVNASLDQFGNVSGLRGRNNLLKRIRNLTEVGFDFLEVPLGQEQQYNGLHAGLYEVIGVGEFANNLNMLFSYEDRRTYRRIWPLDNVIFLEYSLVFPEHFGRELRAAIRTNPKPRITR
jgi:hypothetical protein